MRSRFQIRFARSEIQKGAPVKRSFLIWVILLSLVPFHSDMSAGAGTNCRQEIRPALDMLNKKIRALQKSEPKNGVGRQVPVGSCASRLRKLAGNFLCCTTFQNSAQIWEEISCLGLKKHYLEESCKCAEAGGFSSDEALQDLVLEQYQAFKSARRKAIDRGIKNDLINSYVSEVSKHIDCINYQTLQIVTLAIASIEKIIDEQP
jgi:hypothetical protein